MDVRRLKSLVIIFLLVTVNILLITSPIVKSGVKVSPAKLIITIEEYPEKEIQYKIKITNPYSQEITASLEVKHPYEIEENYSQIPDLSWVKVYPESLVIPSDSYEEIEVIVDIPEDKKTIHNNEKWEAWVIVTPRLKSVLGGMALQMQLAVKLFIHTPESKMTSWSLPAPYIFYPILGAILFLTALFLTIFLIKKKRNINPNKAAIFYIKKKKENESKIK